MDQIFAYDEKGQFCVEGQSIDDLASRHGTPLYLYSRKALEHNWQRFHRAATFDHLCCYAVKANPNLAILNLLARLGAGFDIVSGGELARVLQAGGDPSCVVFSGVGKQRKEIEQALRCGIGCFNVESNAELRLIAEVASEFDCIAPIALRLNPDIDAKTHPYITTGKKHNKFGIPLQQVDTLLSDIFTHTQLQLKGLACHIGSQLTTLEPFLLALDTLLAIFDRLQSEGYALPWLNLGGGLGVRYENETPPSPEHYMEAIAAKIGARQMKVIFEPGRHIVANAGLLITEVLYIKNNGLHNFAICDAAMNDLLRPALYGAHQPIIELNRDAPHRPAIYDVVGPVCESGDFLGINRTLSIAAGERLAICSSGAYGFSMSSNYNSRCRVAELMVDGPQHYLIRHREHPEQLWHGESTLP